MIHPIRFFGPLVILATVAVPSAIAQTTYSRAEEDMARFVNNGLAYAIKYDSLQRIPPVLDSCRRFLQDYPNSFVRSNVFTYMLEMTSLITRDRDSVFSLIDSVLAYDKLPSTRMRIGEILVERELDTELGIAMLAGVLPELSVPYHKYKTHLLLSQTDIAKGNSLTALRHINSAIQIDSVRLDAWYALLGLMRMQEDQRGAAAASNRIDQLESVKRREYYQYVEQGPLTGQSVMGLTPTDLDGNAFPLSRLANQVIVLQYFGFFCTTPGREFPVIKRLIKEFPQVEFVFLNTGETPDELKLHYFTRPSSAFLKDQTVLIKDLSVVRFFRGTAGMGSIFIIDRHGDIRFSFPGTSPGYEDAIRSKIEQLLRE